MKLKEALKDKLTEEELGYLSRSQDIIGDIAIIEIPEELVHKEKLIAETLLEIKSYVKTVLKKGKHGGEFRTQALEYLAGENKKEANYNENGCRFKLNVETVYFSPRLSTERKRIAELVKQSERVLVMFSGCAPFPIVVAKTTEAEEVVGVEINPEGHKYGLESVQLNKLKNVELHCGDVGEIMPTLRGSFDRIVMPAPHNATDFLGEALSKIKQGGTIHLYDFVQDGEENLVEEIIASECEKQGKEFEILGFVKCGQVSAGEYRTCIDFTIIS